MFPPEQPDKVHYSAQVASSEVSYSAPGGFFFRKTAGGMLCLVFSPFRADEVVTVPAVFDETNRMILNSEAAGFLNSEHSKAM